MDQNPELSRILRLCTILLILVGAAVVANHLITGCGPQAKTVEVQAPAPGPDDPGPNPPPPPPAVPCDPGMKSGDTKEVACATGEAGKKIYVCQDAGLQIGINTCKPATCVKTKIDFTDVQPIIQTRCVSCHVADGFDKYPTARQDADEIMRRINLDVQNIQHMPRPGATQLTPAQGDLFRQWKEAGFLEKDPACSGTPGTPNQTFIRLDDQEELVVEDLTTLDVNDRNFTRYADLSHKIDEGISPAELQKFTDAANKTINSVNATDQAVVGLTPVPGSKGSLLRYDLRNFGLSFADYVAVEQADLMAKTSFTTKGKLIKALTGTARAIMPVESLVDTMLHNGVVYTRLLKQPNTQQALEQLLRVNIAEQVRDNKLSLVGIPTSEITSEKNRLLARFVGQSSGRFIAVHETFDTLPLIFQGVSVIQRNLFQFPLLNGIGAKAIFHHDAQETIYELPNGGHAYYLSDAQGQRLNAALTDVVVDKRSPVSSVIQNSISCFNCHNAGFIPAVDQVLTRVNSSASAFVVNDLRLIRDLYKAPASNSANFIADNRPYAAFLSQLGISAADPDPVTVAYNSFQRVWNVAKLGAFFNFTADEAKQCIRDSATLQNTIGQLLDDNGTATFEQIVQVSKQFQLDCEFGQDLN